MTVAELIEKLRAFDQNLRVVTPGLDESGYEDIGDPVEESLMEEVSLAFAHRQTFTRLATDADEPGTEPFERVVLLDFA